MGDSFHAFVDNSIYETRCYDALRILDAQVAYKLFRDGLKRNNEKKSKAK